MQTILKGSAHCAPMLILAIVFEALVACSPAPTQQQTQPQTKQEKTTESDADYIKSNYTKSEHRIPMRDGIELFTAVYSPKDTSEPYPIMLLRTPYSVRPYGEDKFREDKLGSTMLMAKEKFIFVYQDVRGKFMSGGEYMNMRPIIEEKNSKRDVDESSDTFDTIDWLTKNISNNNGKVGMWGISYPGFYAAAALVDSHPALVAVSPQAPIADWFYDDFHHHGAFFPAHAFGFLYSFGQKRSGHVKEWPERFKKPMEDSYKFFLEEVGPLKNINKKYYKNQIPFWNEFVEHPNYDSFWQRRNLLPHMGKLGPAVMIVGGFYDAEDLYGTFKIHRRLEDQNPDSFVMLVAGPWPHGGWSRTDGTSLGNVYFGDDPKPSDYYLNELELPFFKHFLKGADNPGFARAHIFETGANKWRRFDSWPPTGEPLNFYFGKNSSLGFSKPGEEEAFDEFLSDPANPVPYSERVQFRMAKEYMTDDQRFAGTRPDVLVFGTRVLEEDLTIAGPMKASLFVSTTGTDADWVVKVIDEYPDSYVGHDAMTSEVEMGGYQQMIRSEIMRGRFRESYEDPKPFTPNVVEKVEFELLDILHTFKKGHRLVVHVQSTWFPLADRNPQKYVENIFKAKASDFQKAHHRVYRSKTMPSKLKVSTIDLQSQKNN